MTFTLQMALHDCKVTLEKKASLSRVAPQPLKDPAVNILFWLLNFFSPIAAHLELQCRISISGSNAKNKVLYNQGLSYINAP